MNILFILEHYYPYIGGAEILFQQSAEALAAEGHSVKVLTLKFQNELPEKEVISGVEVLRVPCWNRYLFSFFSIPKALKLARKADIIHTTTYNAALPAWLVGKLAKKPVVITFHEVWGQLWFTLPFLGWLASRAFYAFERLLLALPYSHYVAVSKFTQQALMDAGVPEQRISQIYNGLEYEELNRWSFRPPQSFTACYYGRLGVSKGLDLLIPAFAELYRKDSSVRLILIVPTQPMDLLQKLLSLTRKEAIEEAIVFRHELSRAELFQTVSTASCVVIPSYSEGFCFVAAEASAIGLPIVSSGRGALPETVSGKYTLMQEQSVKELLQALEQAKKGKYAERPVQYFELRAARDAYLRLYRQLQHAK